jgi:hypothetical protein
MDVGLARLGFAFGKKPLLVGGKAMEYYGLRKAGADVDLIADVEDVRRLIERYPGRVKDLWGDLGVCPEEFEIWASICLFGYDDLAEGAVDAGEVLVVSLEKLLVMKALAMHKEKYLQDTQLIVQRVLQGQYEQYESVRTRNEGLLAGIEGVEYLERAGPPS